MAFRARAFLRVTLFFSLLATPALASPTYMPPTVGDPSKVEIFLATRGPGAEVYSKYGHTVLRVVDSENHLDLGYNWGMFSFEDPLFVLKFLRGYLQYGLDIGPFNYSIAESRYFHQWFKMERINLTFLQKERVLRRLQALAMPEERWYPYTFFYHNCSTIPRDIFDEALGGKLKETLHRVSSGLSYRDAVMLYNAPIPLFAAGQDIILSASPDHVMSQWEEMFIPLKLRDHLRGFPAMDDQGQPIAGTALLDETNELVAAEEAATPWYNGYMIFWALCGLPSALGLFGIFRLPRPSHGWRLCGLGMMSWGFLSGLFGSFMALSWAFSEHTVLPRNWNLWLMWPLDFWFFAMGLILLLRGDATRFHPITRQITRFLLVGHLGAVALYIPGFFLGLTSQHYARVALWLIPLAALTWGPLARVSPRDHTS